MAEEPEPRGLAGPPHELLSVFVRHVHGGVHLGTRRSPHEVQKGLDSCRVVCIGLYLGGYGTVVYGVRCMVYGTSMLEVWYGVGKSIHVPTLLACPGLALSIFELGFPCFTSCVFISSYFSRFFFFVIFFVFVVVV